MPKTPKKNNNSISHNIKIACVPDKSKPTLNNVNINIATITSVTQPVKIGWCLNVKWDNKISISVCIIMRSVTVIMLKRG